MGEMTKEAWEGAGIAAAILVVVLIAESSGPAPAPLRQPQD
jgi:hypothetical protein